MHAACCLLLRPAESHSPFFSGAAAQRGAHAALDTPTGSGGLPASATNSGVSTPTAAWHHSTGFGQDGSLPTTSSCMDLLQQGKSGSGYAALRRGTRTSGTGSGTSEQQQQQQQLGAGTPKGSGGAAGGLVAAATANAAGLHAAGGLSKLTHSGSWSAVRAAEARAAALSGIKAMPDQPLALLFQLVELMKVLVDQLREKCLEERVEATPNPHSRSSLDRQEAAAVSAAAAAGASDKAGPDKATAAAAAGGSADRAAGGGSLQPLNSARGISSSRYSSLASSPDDWRLDETKPCSGERLLLMFDRSVEGCRVAAAESCGGCRAVLPLSVVHAPAHMSACRCDAHILLLFCRAAVRPPPTPPPQVAQAAQVFLQREEAAV